MSIISSSIYITVLLFFISTLRTNYCADAALCVDSKSKFEIPGQKGKWNCKKVKKKKKNQEWCNGDDTNIVRSNCKKMCGFCPCQDMNGKFKTKIAGKTKRVKCSSKKFCDVDSYGPKFSELCPVKCGTCDEAIDTQAKCLLQATFAHPYDDPDGAPYYGYNGAYLEVQKGKDDTNVCDSGTPKPWCLYENSEKGADVAYVQNINEDEVTDDVTKCEEYYDDDATHCEYLYKESITTRGNLWMTSTFYGYHIYNDYEYYLDDQVEYPADEWRDHMMPPVLKIKVLNTGQILDNDGAGWSSKAVVDILTHTGEEGQPKGEINPEHEGAFSLEVICDGECNCTPGAFETFHWDCTWDRRLIQW